MTADLEFLTIVVALETLHDNMYAEETIIPEYEFEELEDEIMGVLSDKIELKQQMQGLLDNVINYPSLKSKLEKIVEDDSPDLSALIDVDDVLSSSRDRRHDIAHGLQTVDMNEMRILSQKLRLIADAIILREMGVEDKKIIQNVAERYQAVIGISE